MSSKPLSTTGAHDPAFELKALLSRRESLPPDALTYYGTCGFLLALSPAPVPVSGFDCAPLIFAGHPPFKNVEHKRRICQQVVALYEDVFDACALGELPQGCELYDEPLSNFAKGAPVSQWSHGFLRGFAWARHLWHYAVPPLLTREFTVAISTLALFGDRDKAERALLMPSADKLTLEQMASFSCEMFPSALKSYTHNAAHAFSQRTGSLEPVRRRKIRRNEPCVCGSGVKYKRCCARVDRR